MGLRVWREYYGEQLVERLGEQVRDPRRWTDLVRSLVLLARHHPGGLVTHTRKKFQRAAAAQHGSAASPGHLRTL